MAKKRKKRKDFEEGGRFGLAEETVHAVLAVVFFAIGTFFILAAFDVVGVVGHYLFTFLSKLLGLGYYLLPALGFLLGSTYARSEKTHVALAHVLGSLLFCLSGLGLIEVVAVDRGGLIGKLIESPLSYLFDTTGSVIFLGALFLISLLILSNTNPITWLRELRERRAEERELDEEDEEEDDDEAEIIMPATDEEEPPKEHSFFGKKKKEEEPEEHVPAFSPFIASMAPYTPPPLSIFARDSGTPGVGDIKANANIIKRTLQNFGIDVAMDEVSIGPSVTRYAMKPAEGVRLSKILGLQKNLELALAAHPVRIEAPIPGKSLVGVEVPNSAKTTSMFLTSATRKTRS